MRICGLQKTTLLDYPGHVAATIFTGGCNFQCPYCHNSQLISCKNAEEYPEEEILSFLKKRTRILEGVVISGGEPTIWPDLRDFIIQIKDIGYKVKLDTNGTNPDLLKQLCNENLIDYVAMDIKHDPAKYQLFHPHSEKIEDILQNITESKNFLMNECIPYEFRTTIVKGIHSNEDIKELAKWISGCERYYLQQYVDSEFVLDHNCCSYSEEEMRKMLDIVKMYVKSAELRGI